MGIMAATLKDKFGDLGMSPRQLSQNMACADGRLDDIHESDHGTGDLLVDSSFAVR